MENVLDIKEESITDFLVWKWRELDKRFNYIHVHPFNHEEESSRTGADFDMELWLVGRRHHFALAVQAKKFIKRTDSYVTRLRYPNGTKKQMTTLLSYASAKKRHPFYFIYSLPDSNSPTMCGGRSGTLGAVFTADARRIEEYADGKHGKRITRDHLLSISNPFHCIFCRPLSDDGCYPDSFFGGEQTAYSNELLPSYVHDLLQRNETVNAKEYRTPHENAKKSRTPHEFRVIGVYDMRYDA